MEVVACAVACASNISDDLTLYNIIAVFDSNGALMRVNRNVSVVVGNSYAVSVTAVPAAADFDNSAAFSRIDRRSVRSSDINTLMTSAVALIC